MANNDPTAILSSIVAVPFSILGTSLQEFVSTAWNMGENAKAAEEALEMTLAMGEILVFQNSSVVQNKGKEKVEQVRSALDDAKGASSSTSWNPFHRFIHSRRISKARNELEGFRSTAILAGVQNIQKSLQGQENASCLASLAYFTCLPVPTAQPVVGISDLVSRLQSTLLDGNSPQWISVTGAGGMGKSFMVRIVCNTQEVRDHFGDNILWLSFSHDCMESDQLRVQSNLFVRLSGQQTVGHFMTLSSGNNALQALIMRQQQRKPYLLVLDNVWSRPVLENFDFLRGSDGSKVIVTSRFRDIVRHTDRTVIDMNGLSEENAYQLFCKYAFNGIDSAPAELEDHVRMFIGHCGGNPLMLEVLGKFMRRRSLPGQWEYVLREIESRKLSHQEHEHVFQMLRLSYDVLDDLDKKRFLFIVSLERARGFSRELSEMIFYCWRGLHFLSYDDNMEMAREEYDNAIETLCSASLVSSLLWVPDIIQQLADYIIWKDNLSHSTGYRTSFYKAEPLSVGMMTLDFPEVGDHISADYFNHFPNLQALEVRYDLDSYIPWGLIQLRYLDLQLNKFVLDVSMATALCESLKHLSRLEYLSIRGDAAEEIIFDLGFLECMPNLTRLLLKVVVEVDEEEEEDYYTGGGSFTLEVDEEFEDECEEKEDYYTDGVRLINSHHIQNLTKLEMIELLTFEDWDLQRLKHLKVIKIKGTTKDITPGPSSHSDRFLSSLSTCTRLQELVLHEVAFNRVPAEIHWPHLTKLHLEVAMQCLPNTWLQSLPRLEELELDGGGMLVEHPPFDKLPRLRSLVLSKLAGDHISFTPEEHPSLAHFAIENCVNLVELPALEKLPELKSFKVRGCAIQQFPEATVEDLKIIDCKKLIRLPSSTLEKVRRLVLCGLTSLEWSREASFPSFLPSLKKLSLKAGTAFPLGSIEAPNLFRLDVKDGKMKHLPLIPFPRLKRLCIEGCAEMETILPDDTPFPVCFPNLRDLCLIELPKLVRVPSTLIPFPKLESLCIKGCAEMESDDTHSPCASQTCET